jgi:putative tryptophan/tyrosine transport system substrate-binding protein
MPTTTQIPTIHLGWLAPGALAAEPYREVLDLALQAYGWPQIRLDDGLTDRGWAGFADRAAALVRRQVAVIIASGTPAALGAKEATIGTPIPVVMVAVGDPVRTGLVAHLAQPEGNLTGLTTLLPASMENRLHLLHTVVPGLARVAVLWQPDNSANRLAWQETQSAGAAMGLTLVSHPVRTPGDLEAAFATMARQGADGLLTCEDALIVAQRRRIVTLAAAHRLPAVYPLREFVEAGGLMAYGPNFTVLYRRAAAYVDRLLRGAKPVDLAIEQPRQYEFVFHRQTARALGLTLPSSLIEQTDEVFG